MHQRKETYGKIIEHIKERDRISADQVKSLMESLTLVIEDYDNEHVIETKRTNSSDDGAYFALGQKKNAYSSDPCHSSAESKEAGTFLKVRQYKKLHIKRCTELFQIT